MSEYLQYTISEVKCVHVIEINIGIWFYGVKKLYTYNLNYIY